MNLHGNFKVCFYNYAVIKSHIYTPGVIHHFERSFCSCDFVDSDLELLQKTGREFSEKNMKMILREALLYVHVKGNRQ